MHLMYFTEQPLSAWDPDTAEMWRFRDRHELWAIVSRATSTPRVSWHPGQGGDTCNRKE